MFLLITSFAPIMESLVRPDGLVRYHTSFGFLSDVKHGLGQHQRCVPWKRLISIGPMPLNVHSSVETFSVRLLILY
jgi:hypothetical protein